MKILNVQKWERVRARGLRHFIVFNGLLGFGLLSAAFTLLVVWLGSRFGFFGSEMQGSDIWTRLVVLVAAIIFIGGPAWAVATWNLTEWLFRRVTGSANSNAGV